MSFSFTVKLINIYQNTASRKNETAPESDFHSLLPLKRLLRGRAAARRAFPLHIFIFWAEMFIFCPVPIRGRMGGVEPSCSEVWEGCPGEPQRQGWDEQSQLERSTRQRQSPRPGEFLVGAGWCHCCSWGQCPCHSTAGHSRLTPVPVFCRWEG